ncbi:MAG: transcriptional repressor [Phycisphaeraceae bacterium]|nr:transcriptional repressor [Phycisphaeraceae bacterium]
MEKTKQIRSLFTQRGLRFTQQRRAIYEALEATKSHPTADDLFHMVSPRLQGLSLATVYNTLEALCDAGLALRLPSGGSAKRGGGSARYDATVENHLHLRCSRTGVVADVPKDFSSKLLEQISPSVLRELEHQMGFKIQLVQIELVGQFHKAS